MTFKLEITLERMLPTLNTLRSNYLEEANHYTSNNFESIMSIVLKILSLEEGDLQHIPCVDMSHYDTACSFNRWCIDLSSELKCIAGDIDYAPIRSNEYIACHFPAIRRLVRDISNGRIKHASNSVKPFGAPVLYYYKMEGDIKCGPFIDNDELKDALYQALRILTDFFNRSRYWNGSYNDLMIVCETMSCLNKMGIVCEDDEILDFTENLIFINNAVNLYTKYFGRIPDLDKTITVLFDNLYRVRVMMTDARTRLTERSEMPSKSDDSI
jgi:hypothetical protein